MDYSAYFKNRNVVITGHTGFKGSWLSQWLHMLGAKIYAFSLDIPTNPSHYKILKKKNHSMAPEGAGNAEQCMVKMEILIAIGKKHKKKKKKHKKMPKDSGNGTESENS